MSQTKKSGGSTKHFQIDQKVPEYPIKFSAQQVERKESPAESLQKSKKLNIEVTDLQRLYHDMIGINDLSLKEIEDLRAKAKHCYPDVKEWLYWNREHGINEYYKRFAQWFLLRKDLGLLNVEGGMMHPKNKVLEMNKYQLDSGPLTLHYYAFLPAVELLASEEQYKYWVPRTNNL